MKKKKVLKKFLLKYDLNKLILYCEEKKWNVTFKRIGVDKAFTSTGIIEINRNQSLERQIHTLLHEIGHMFINSELKLYTESKFRGYWSKEFTQVYKTTLLEEEFDAWNRGKRLAERLKLGSFDEKAYLRTKKECIYSYIRSFIEDDEERQSRNIKKDKNSTVVLKEG